MNTPEAGQGQIQLITASLGFEPAHQRRAGKIQLLSLVIDLKGKYPLRQAQIRLAQDLPLGVSIECRLQICLPPELGGLRQPLLQQLEGDLFGLQVGTPALLGLRRKIAADPGLFRDLFVALGEDLGNGAWSLRVYHKPFLGWLWIGAALMALGGLLAATDRRYRVLARRSAAAAEDSAKVSA